MSNSTADIEMTNEPQTQVIDQNTNNDSSPIATLEEVNTSMESTLLSANSTEHRASSAATPANNPSGALESTEGTAGNANYQTNARGGKAVPSVGSSTQVDVHHGSPCSAPEKAEGSTKDASESDKSSNRSFDMGSGARRAAAAASIASTSKDVKPAARRSSARSASKNKKDSTSSPGPVKNFVQRVQGKRRSTEGSTSKKEVKPKEMTDDDEVPLRLYSKEEFDKYKAEKQVKRDVQIEGYNAVNQVLTRTSSTNQIAPFGEEVHRDDTSIHSSYSVAGSSVHSGKKGILKRRKSIRFASPVHDGGAGPTQAIISTPIETERMMEEMTQPAVSGSLLPEDGALKTSAEHEMEVDSPLQDASAVGGETLTHAEKGVADVKSKFEGVGGEVGITLAFGDSMKDKEDLVNGTPSLHGPHYWSTRDLPTQTAEPFVASGAASSNAPATPLVSVEDDNESTSTQAPVGFFKRMATAISSSTAETVAFFKRSRPNGRMARPTD